MTDTRRETGWGGLELGAPRIRRQVGILSWRVRAVPGGRDLRLAPRRMLDALEQVLQSHELPFVLYDRVSGRAAAGLGSPSDPVLRLVLCALRMIEVSRPWHASWPVQLGIHHGTVCAGEEPAAPHPFHLSGAAVATAEAVRDVARANTVTTTSVAWDHVRSHLRGLGRGHIVVPGAGSLEVVECTGAIEPHHH